jgi:hypothetical protein
MTFDLNLNLNCGGDVLPRLNQILLILSQMETKMGDIATDLQDLADTVTAIAGTLTTVLDRLKAGNFTPDQLTAFEQQIAALHGIRDQLNAAAGVQPVPTPNPQPTPEPTPNPDQPTPPANP